jgi:hypothetical protein
MREESEPREGACAMECSSDAFANQVRGIEQYGFMHRRVTVPRSIRFLNASTVWPRMVLLRMPLFGPSGILRNLGRADLDVRVRTDGVRNLLIGVAALSRLSISSLIMPTKAPTGNNSVGSPALSRSAFWGTECFFNGVLSASLLCHICRAPPFLVRRMKNRLRRRVALQ